MFLWIKPQHLQADGSWTINVTFEPLFVCVYSVAHSCPTLYNPMTVVCQAPQCMGFSRQEYWSWLPFPLPGDLPNPGIEPTSLSPPALTGGFFTTAPPGKPLNLFSYR